MSVRYQAVIFDMDGTLSVPYINWTSLRQQIDCPVEKTIIEHINGNQLTKDNSPLSIRFTFDKLLLVPVECFTCFYFIFSFLPSPIPLFPLSQIKYKLS